MRNSDGGFRSSRGRTGANGDGWLNAFRAGGFRHGNEREAMPEIALGKLKVSDRTCKRAEALLYLMSNVLDLPCAVVDIREDRVIYEYPAHHINSCFCKRLEPLTGNRYNLTHFVERCHRVGIDSSNSVYNCPFGLINILVPIFDDAEYVAALQIGPFIVDDPESHLLKHGLSLPDISSPSESLQEAIRYLRQLPKATTDYLAAITRLARAVMTDEQIDVQLMAASHGQRSDDEGAGEAGGRGKGADYDLIYAIQQFVSENYANPNICLELVARHVYVHPSYVSHIFSEKFGVAFRDYVNWLRVKRAKDLLVNTDKPIGEVCRIIGYADHSYFNKIFKRQEGMTPTEFRNMKR